MRQDQRHLQLRRRGRGAPGLPQRRVGGLRGQQFTDVGRRGKGRVALALPGSVHASEAEGGQGAGRAQELGQFHHPAPVQADRVGLAVRHRVHGRLLSQAEHRGPRRAQQVQRQQSRQFRAGRSRCCNPDRRAAQHPRQGYAAHQQPWRHAGQGGDPLRNVEPGARVPHQPRHRRAARKQQGGAPIGHDPRFELVRAGHTVGAAHYVLAKGRTGRECPAKAGRQPPGP